MGRLCLSCCWKEPDILQPGKAPVALPAAEDEEGPRLQSLVWWLRAKHNLSASFPG